MILVVFVSCSKLTDFLTAAFISVEKHCPVIFCWVALCFREIIYAKNLKFSKRHLLEVYC